MGVIPGDARLMDMRVAVLVRLNLGVRVGACHWWAPSFLMVRVACRLT
jgi:hypothetical protein